MSIGQIVHVDQLINIHNEIYYFGNNGDLVLYKGLIHDHLGLLEPREGELFSVCDQDGEFIKDLAFVNSEFLDIPEPERDTVWMTPTMTLLVNKEFFRFDVELSQWVVDDTVSEARVGMVTAFETDEIQVIGHGNWKLRKVNDTQPYEAGIVFTRRKS